MTEGEGDEGEKVGLKNCLSSWGIEPWSPA